MPMAGPAVDAQMQLAYNLYWMMMDWDSRNAVGVEPAKKLVDDFEAISSIEELSQYVVDTPYEQQLGCAWKSGGTINPNDSSSVLLAVMLMTPMLEDAGEYLEQTQMGALMSMAEGTLAQRMLVKLGYTEEEAAAKYQNCLDFEGMLATAMYPDSVKKTPEYFAMVNNFFSLEEMKELQGNAPILESFSAMGYADQEQYMVAEPEYVKKLNELWTDDNLQLIKDCFIVHGSRSFAVKLDRECYDWIQEYQGMMTGHGRRLAARRDHVHQHGQLPAALARCAAVFGEIPEAGGQGSHRRDGGGDPSSLSRHPGRGGLAFRGHPREDRGEAGSHPEERAGSGQLGRLQL